MSIDVYPKAQLSVNHNIDTATVGTLPEGYEITGDLVDACLLDVVFYERDDDVDFCQLQIPINYEE